MLLAKAFSKDFRSSRYFLGSIYKRITLSQMKYVFDMLSLAGILGCRSAHAPMETKIKLLPYPREILDDLDRYEMLVSKLNYLTITRPDVSFIVSAVGQFLSAPRITH